jgi:hypothetical protein
MSNESTENDEHIEEVKNEAKKSKISLPLEITGKNLMAKVNKLSGW